MSDSEEVEQFDNTKKDKKVVVNFSDVNSPKVSELKDVISSASMRAIKSFGFTELTEIQAKAIPPLLEGKDLRGTAKTGSGKTLAFVLPAIELLTNLGFTRELGTGVIIMSPTRELAMQTYSVVKVFADEHNLSHGLVMGGNNMKTETKELVSGMNALVCTPGRVLDHIKNTEGFKYSNLCCLILDEADRMLADGFEEEMRAIIRELPKRRQTMLFSATRTPKTDALCSMSLKVSLVDVDVDANKTNSTVDQLKEYYLECETEKRFLVLYSFLRHKSSKKVMVFFSSCDAVIFYHELLNLINIPVMCIHGKKKQKKRSECFMQFNAAKSGVLLCTDVAARGWDIPAVDWIIQYDPPEDTSEYLHRVGRTARAGKEGTALLMLRHEELPFIDFLKERKSNIKKMSFQESKIFNKQKSLEKLMNDNYNLACRGRTAFKSYLHTYMKHKQKDIFNVHTLDQYKVGKAFGFDRPPVIDLSIEMGKRKGERNEEYKKKRFKINRR